MMIHMDDSFSHEHQGAGGHHEVDDEDEEGGGGELHRQVGRSAREIKGAQPIHAARALLQHHLELAAASNTSLVSSEQ